MSKVVRDSGKRTAYIRELEEEVRNLHMAIESERDMQESYNKLQDQMEICIRTLEWYGDPENYSVAGILRKEEITPTKGKKIVKDFGEKAQDALVNSGNANVLLQMDKRKESARKREVDEQKRKEIW